ncbi:MAG: 4-hydroxy-tetrahydrodipicolinate reductase [Bacteroidales bacterium]
MSGKKIVLIGYGRMGKEVEKVALKRGHCIVAKIDKEEDWVLEANNLKIADLAIEFSTPLTVVKNIEKCFAINLPVVVGTTAWNADLPRIEHLCQEKKQSLFHASNFSIGVYMFFALNRTLAKMMNTQEQYNVQMEEIHHIHKLDKPSGTAISLAEIVIEELDRIRTWSLDDGLGDLHIKALRKEAVVGVHELVYESDEDRILVRHEAKSRSGFALGAVMAAEWLIGKTGCFSMKDMLPF